MNLDVVTEDLSNLEISKRQLNRAIDLFLFENDFVSALTLAGAAEEILGKLLKLSHNKHALDELIDNALVLNEITKGSSEGPQARKKIANFHNFFKNKMKHYNQEGSVCFSVDYYAAQIIDRAITNYYNHTSSKTSLMKKFSEEIMENHEIKT